MRAVDFIFAHKPRPAAALIAVTLFLLIGAPALLHHGSDVWQRGGEKAGSAAQSEATSPTADAAESKALPSLSQSPAETDEEPPSLTSVVDTMLWLPNAVTDENGALQVEFPVADSITTWRVSALASAQDGRLGSATSDLRVYQDFFIHVDLPPALTVGDQISVPVAIYNYLPEPQRLRLEVEQARWFELLSASGREIEIAPNDVTTAYFSIRVLDFGRQPFQVTAWGSAMSDAVREEVRVAPNGDERRLTRANLVMTNAPSLSETLTLPDTAIPGTQALTVKLTPGVVSQLVEILGALQRLPTGSFEPTASATYPSALLLDYLQETGQTAPEAQMQAEAQINAGYQRLTTFEVPGEPGGFSRFGQAPADPVLTAYGLQASARCSASIPSIRRWWIGWPRGSSSISARMARGRAIAASPRRSACQRRPSFSGDWRMRDMQRTRARSRRRNSCYPLYQRPMGTPGYTLALIANALVTMEITSDGEIVPATQGVLQHLANLAIHEGDIAYWESGRATYLGSTGMSADLETTAMAASWPSSEPNATWTWRTLP